jgi:hypothetical protein
MNRTVLAGLAAVLLVPGLAFAQEGRGGARRGPQGLPPGVWEVKKEQATAAAARPEARMLMEHLRKMSARLDRLEQAVRGLMAARQGEPRAPQGPQAMGPRGPQAMGPRGPQAGRAGQMDRQALMARGAARLQGHPQLRALAQRVRQNAPQAWQRMRQAFQKRQGALRRGERFQGAQGRTCPHCGKGMAQARQGAGPRAAMTPPARDRAMQRGRGGPAGPHARRGGPDRPARGEYDKDAKAPATPTKGAPAERLLQAENVRLKAHVKRLEAQLERLAAQIKKLHRVG